MALGSAVVLSIAISEVVHRPQHHGRPAGASWWRWSASASRCAAWSSVAGPLQQGIAAGQSIFELLDEPVEPPGGALVATRVRGDIEFDRVSFSYPVGKGVTLHDLSLQVAAGQRARDRRQDRQRQVDGGEPVAALLRRQRGLGPRRRPRRSRVRAGEPARADRARQPGSRAVQRHHPRQHRVRPQRGAGRDRGGGARRARAWSSRRRCRRASTRWWATAACCSRAVSGSASRSRGRC